MNPLAAASFEPSLLLEGARLVAWLAGVLIAAVALFPVGRRLFPRFGDGLRAAASVAMGVAMIGGASWLAARCGAPKSLAWALGWLAWGALAAWGWTVERRRRARLRSAARGALPLLGLQAAWAMLFLLLADFQTFEHLNLAFLQSIIRWDAFPPLDPFLAGAAMNYHYLPQWCWASILGPLALDPALHWGLLAAANAAVATLIFHGAARRWAGRVPALAATVVAFAGGNGVFLLDWLGRLDAPLASFDATREIAFQTTRFWFRMEAEYPFFSFWHGRFHGYLFSCGYLFLGAVALLETPRLHLRANASRGALAGALIAVAACSSALDAPAALLLAGFSLLLWPERWRGALVRAAACGAVATSLAWTFQSSLDLSGGRVVRLAASATELPFLAIAFGFPALLMAAGVLAAAIEAKKTKRASPADEAGAKRGRLIASLALAAAMVAPAPAMVVGVAPWNAIAALGLLGALPALALFRAGASERLRGAAALATTATGLMLAAEAITILSPAETNNAERFNVYVKFGFLAWLLLAWAGAWAIGRPSPGRAPRAIAGRWIFPLVALISAAGPAWLIARRATEIARDGAGWSFNAYAPTPGEPLGYAGAAAAIRERAGSGAAPEIVAQAGTESWSEDPNMPARTGLLSPLSSRHQTIQRHGAASIARAISRRETLLGRAFASPNRDGAFASLIELGARFVVVGPVERRIYDAALNRFDGDARFAPIYRDDACSAWEVAQDAKARPLPPDAR